MAKIAGAAGPMRSASCAGSRAGSLLAELKDGMECDTFSGVAESARLSVLWGVLVALLLLAL